MRSKINKVMTTVGKKTVEVIKTELGNHRQKTLIHDCFSGDKVKKILALSKLKKEYPETYSEVKKEMK